MPARRQTIVIEQGATFSLALKVAAADGSTCRGSLRDRFGGTLLATFAATVVLNGTTTVSLTAAETAALIWPIWADLHEREVKFGVYDVESVNGATVAREWQGDAFLSLEAST